MTIFYDTANQHRLELIEYRGELALYNDLDDNTRVLCNPKAVDLYPRQAAPFAPVQCKPRPVIVPKVKEGSAGNRLPPGFMYFAGGGSGSAN